MDIFQSDRIPTSGTDERIISDRAMAEAALIQLAQLSMRLQDDGTEVSPEAQGEYEWVLDLLAECPQDTLASAIKARIPLILNSSSIAGPTVQMLTEILEAARRIDATTPQLEPDKKVNRGRDLYRKIGAGIVVALPLALLASPAHAAPLDTDNSNTNSSGSSFFVIDEATDPAAPQTHPEPSAIEQPESDEQVIVFNTSVVESAAPSEQPASAAVEQATIRQPEPFFEVVDEVGGHEASHNPSAAATQLDNGTKLGSAPQSGPSVADFLEKRRAENAKPRLAKIRYNQDLTKSREEGKLYHRSGSVSYAFENSPQGIEYAIENGYKRIDIDLQVTKDGVVVATHTRRPLIKNRIKGGFRDTSGVITDKKIEISDMTYEQVQQLKHAKGYTIHSLEDLIEVADNNITLFLELKTPKLLIDKLPEITEMLNKAGQKATIGGIMRIKGQKAALKRAQELGFWTRKLYLGRKVNTWHGPLPPKPESTQIDDN